MKALLSALRRLGRGYSDDAGPISALGLLLVGLVAIALGLKGIWLDASWDTPAWWHVVPLLVGCAGNAVRKSHPAITLGLAVPAFVADAAIGGSLALLLVLFDGIYSAERFGSERLRRVVRFGAGVVVAGVVIAAVLGGLSFQTTAGLTLQIAAMLLIPVWWAMDVRHRSELAEAATARAELETARAAEQARAQDAERRGAVQAERSRMARELHDSVAGDVSALVIRAGAALAAPPGPADRESLAAVRENGLHALAELRTMIDVLAAEGANEPVAPVLTEDGADLLARFEGTTLDGVPPGALAPLSPVVDRAGYRILQEALTNAARHGTAGTAAVCLSRENGHVRLEVSNAVEHGERGTGLGVTSMTERAHAVGGRVTIDEAAGTWTMAARLPTAEVIR